MQPTVSEQTTRRCRTGCLDPTDGGDDSTPGWCRTESTVIAGVQTHYLHNGTSNDKATISVVQLGDAPEETAAHDAGALAQRLILLRSWMLEENADNETDDVEAATQHLLAVVNTEARKRERNAFVLGKDAERLGSRAARDVDALLDSLAVSVSELANLAGQSGYGTATIGRQLLTLGRIMAGRSGA